VEKVQLLNIKAVHVVPAVLLSDNSDLRRITKKSDSVKMTVFWDVAPCSLEEID
jgi:hypothetical protein